MPKIDPIIYDSAAHSLTLGDIKHEFLTVSMQLPYIAEILIKFDAGHYSLQEAYSMILEIHLNSNNNLALHSYVRQQKND